MNQDKPQFNKADTRAYHEGNLVGFDHPEHGSMTMDQDTAAQQHFNLMGYNKGTAGEMLKNSKKRIGESVKAGEINNQVTRRATQRKIRNRDQSNG